VRKHGLLNWGLLALLGGALSATGATAATTTGTMSVTATVQAMCLISTNPLAFGTYTGAQIDATSTLNITCTSTTPYNVGLNAGTATGATVTTRQMTGPASSLLNYALYSNAGRTTNWGDTVGADTVAGTGTGAAQTLTVYGRLPSGQFNTPGGYTDTITATVTY
jgi:spore coat protein U-like protein